MVSARNRRLAAAALAAVGSSSSLDASAEPETDEWVSSPSIPLLTHRDFTFDYQYTGAGIQPAKGAVIYPGEKSVEVAWMVHADIEYPIIPRQWFFGVAGDLASASAPGVGRALIYGNPELWVRGVWSSKSGISAGGSLGFVVPLPRDLDTAGRAALQTVEAVRPWDSAYFSDTLLTLRPALDMSARTSVFLFQLRQGLDLSYSFEDGHTELLGRTELYAGANWPKPVLIGIEGFETYPLSSDIPDGKRSAVTLAPSIRFHLPGIEPGVSALFPISTPLSPLATSFFGVRMFATFVLDERHDQPSGSKR